MGMAADLKSLTAKLLLAIAKTGILSYEFHGTHSHVLLPSDLSCAQNLKC
jgi:hypothetical protein